MPNKEKKESTEIFIQLVDKNSSWMYKKGFYVKGLNIVSVDKKSENVINALKMGVIKKVNKPKD